MRKLAVLAMAFSAACGASEVITPGGTNSPTSSNGPQPGQIALTCDASRGYSVKQCMEFRVAQAENLRALLVEEETLAGLTPEFLNLKFQRQEGLASARRQEIDAIASFDRAVSSLYRAMGVGLSMKNIQVEVVDENPAADAGLWGDVKDWPR